MARKLERWESTWINNRTYIHYYNRLTELAISMFEWKNLPDTVDARFMELALFTDGMAVFFYDDVLGYLCLQTMIGGNLNVYRIPKIRTAYATNGYNMHLNDENSVVIFNNMLHTNMIPDVEHFARKLYEADRTVDVNIKAQKTPVMITCDENQRLTMKNMYAKYEGNEPFIFGGKDMDINKIQAVVTGAPFVADKVQQTKMQIWNEALTFLGISNTNTEKKERLITDEVSTSMGSTVASRYTRLEMRKKACKEINAMFGLNIDVEYREDLQIDDNENINDGEEDNNEPVYNGS